MQNKCCMIKIISSYNNIIKFLNEVNFEKTSKLTTQIKNV